MEYVSASLDLRLMALPVTKYAETEYRLSTNVMMAIQEMETDAARSAKFKIIICVQEGPQ